MKKALEKHHRAAELEYSAEDLRWATPEVVAAYRAKRLQCNTIVDIGCGIGFQSFAFAKTCTKVYALDIDAQKIERAQKNAEGLGFKNIVFIRGDALSDVVIQQLKNIDIVFCDPERLPEEKERNMETIQPNIQRVLKEYSRLTTKIALEFPPQIKNLPFDCEREYLSWQGKLNRLTLYFNDLKKAERSVAVLPDEAMLQKGTATLKRTKDLGKYLYEADPAVVKADLLAELSQQTGAALVQEGKNTLFTADKKMSSPFFVNSFQCLAETTPEMLVETLNNLHVGKVILRFSVDPQEYWTIRKKYEAELRGEKIAHLFDVSGKIIVAQKMSPK